MRLSITSILLIFMLIFSSAMAQEKSKKEQKADEKAEKIAQTSLLLENGEFVFIARSAFPQGEQSIDLSTLTNYVKIRPGHAECRMPYFGAVTAGVGFGTDAGIVFNGKPDEFSITSSKKKVFVKMTLRSMRDTYRMTLAVSPQGNATLIVISNGRSSITYNGGIFPLEKK